MKAFVITGAQPGTVFTLDVAPPAGTPYFICLNGIIQMDVSDSSGSLGQGTFIRSNLTVTMGVTVNAGDDLFGYYQTSIVNGLLLTTVKGGINSVNKSFKLGTTFPANSTILLARNGVLQTPVTGVPGVAQFAITNVAITMGSAPDPGDLLQAWVEQATSIFFHQLTLNEDPDGSNTIFTAHAGVQAGQDIATMVILNGQIQEKVIQAPAVTQFMQERTTTTITFTLGEAPNTDDYFAIYAIGNIPGAGVSAFLLNLRQVERRLIMLMAGQVDQPECSLCIDEQWRELILNYQWSFTKTDSVLSTLPSKTGGTITLTQNSSLVVGSGTNFTMTDIGAFLTVSAQPYKIVDVDVTDQVLTLWAPFPGTTVSTTYQLFQNIYPLDPDVVKILTAADANWPLEERTQQFLDDLDTGRTVTGEPIYYAYRAETEGGILQVELWPVPVAVFNYRYTSLLRTALVSETQIISDMSDVLLKGSAIMACSMIANKMAASGRLDVAAHFERQIPVWDGKFKEALHAFKKIDRRRFGIAERVESAWWRLAGRTDIDVRFLP